MHLAKAPSAAARTAPTTAPSASTASGNGSTAARREVADKLKELRRKAEQAWTVSPGS
jgi:hypothetical protein